MILPEKQDLGKRVFTRGYRKTEAGTVGEWIEGRIDVIGKMVVMVEFKEGMLELNRADLEWSVS